MLAFQVRGTVLEKPLESLHNLSSLIFEYLRTSQLPLLNAQTPGCNRPTESTNCSRSRQAGYRGYKGSRLRVEGYYPRSGEANGKEHG